MRVQLDFDQVGGSEELGIDDIAVTGVSTLPIKLLWFNAANSLNGFTTFELENRDEQSDAVLFDIERSENGIDFSVCKTITAGSERTYSTLDNSNTGNVVYYRLRMTDSRGIITYSSVVRVNKNIKTLQVNGPFPNPVKTNCSSTSHLPQKQMP